MDKEVDISRRKLIGKCEQFLNGELEKVELESYASNLIFSDSFEWEDDTISDILFQWDSQDMSFPITERNIELWIHQLKTDEDLLDEYNKWNVHIDRQKEMCERHDSKWNPVNKKLMIGATAKLDSDPIHGLRHPKEKGTTGWFIWTGEYSETKDFFKPLCAEHLLQIRPQLIKYFGLDVGFRFLIDSKGHEDVWYDEQLKNVE